MPVISLVVATAADDVLSGRKFKTLTSPSLITLAATTVTAAETLSFSVDSQEFASGARINVETTDRSVDIERDALLVQEVVPAGEMFLNVPAIAADMSFVLIIEPITG